MALTIITAEGSGAADDSYVAATSNVDWATVRGDASSSGYVQSSSSSTNDFGIYNIFTSGRGGASYIIRRSYFSFNLASLVGTVSSVKVSLYLDNLGTVGGSKDQVQLVQATDLEGGTQDFGNCFSSGSTLGLNLAPDVIVSTTAGYHNFIFNVNGRDAVQALMGTATNPLFVVCLMGYYYDYRNLAPSLGGDLTQIKVYYSEGSSGFDPIMGVTYDPPNAVFMGHNF